MLGLTLSQMAGVLGLANGRDVRRFEAPADRSSARPPAHACAQLYRLILAGRVSIEDFDALTAGADNSRAET